MRPFLDVNLKTRFFEGQNCLNPKLVKKMSSKKILSDLVSKLLIQFVLKKIL